MEHLFEKLAPPPAGLEGLRRKLQKRRSRPIATVRFAGAAAIMLVLAVIVYRILPPERSAETEYGIFQRYMEAPPSEAVVLNAAQSTGLRLVEQSVGNPAVSLYWIEEEDG